MSEPATRAEGCIVLGSRSPRRYELLSLLAGSERIVVRPPANANEAGFDGLPNIGDISERLTQIARAKNDDVAAQLRSVEARGDVSAVLTADTVIVARDEHNRPVVLGQPPDDDTWRDVVREWFTRYLLRKPHTALSAVCISTPYGRMLEEVARTEVSFRPDPHWVDWYLETGDSRGKAGGYALQGAGSLFVDLIHGSPSNVVGLPLRETGGMLRELQLI